MPSFLTAEPAVGEYWNPSPEVLSGHTELVAAIAFSSTGQLLASGAEDGTIQLWNQSTGTLSFTFVGHTGRILTLAFARDGEILASRSSDRTVRLWSLR